MESFEITFTVPLSIKELINKIKPLEAIFLICYSSKIRSDS